MISFKLRGLFITFEGLDGSGKTTQIEMAARRLRRNGCKVLVAREPGGTRVGDAIRAILLSSRTVGLDARAEVLLYFASRAQNVSEVILPALKKGYVVLCDRFTDSSRAYQGQGRQLGAGAIEQLDGIACQGLRPDRTVLIDISQRHGVQRARKRNTSAANESGRDENRMEREGARFFTRVRRAFLVIAKADPQRVHVVNGNRSVEEIHTEIWNDLWDLIHSSGTRRR
jgi:dTMP kinase